MSEPATNYCLEVTDAELDFILYTMGYMLASADHMDDGHQHYIREHHYSLLPKLIGAKKKRQ